MRHADKPHPVYLAKVRRNGIVQIAAWLFIRAGSSARAGAMARSRISERVMGNPSGKENPALGGGWDDAGGCFALRLSKNRTGWRWFSEVALS